MLTANQGCILTPQIQLIAEKYDKTIPKITFRFALQIGILSLTGTTDLQHMSDDLNIHDFELSSEDMQYLENIGTEIK